MAVEFSTLGNRVKHKTVRRHTSPRRKFNYESKFVNKFFRQNRKLQPLVLQIIYVQPLEPVLIHHQLAETP